MVTLTTPHGTFTADDEAGAMKAARKAKAEAKRQERLAHEHYRLAMIAANYNAVRIFSWFHEGVYPSAHETTEPGTQHSCAIPQDDGSTKIFNGDHVGIWERGSWPIMRCVEMPSGVIAIALRDRHSDNVCFYAIGCHEGTIATVTLPECVGKWVCYPA